MRFALIGSRSLAVAVTKGLLRRGDTLHGYWAPIGDGMHTVAAKEGWRRLYPGARLAACGREPFEGAELIVCAHNYEYVPEAVRTATPYGALSYHPSLLPRHRGRDAVKWTVEAGDAIAGGTVYWLDEGLDTGPIAAQEWCHVVPGWTASDLWREALFPMGVQLLRRAVADVSRGRVVKIAQDERVATYEPVFDEERERSGLRDTGGAASEASSIG